MKLGRQSIIVTKRWTASTIRASLPALSCPLRPTFCVWELGVVAHEAKAWSRFLTSPRSEEDEAIWRNDVLSADV